ncbi:hypothetical protein I4U23_011127 [Adineta vaga]|nr:hypothetical protein I4U23_011127 [Adineta vaga]
MPMINNYPQIKSIYILSNKELYQSYSCEEDKVRGVFTNIDEMIEQFRQDANKSNYIYYSEESTFRHIDKQSAQVLWWKLFDKFIQYIQYTDMARNEFIDFAREQFVENQLQLRHIEDFENTYKSYEAIYWYTRDTFLYRLVNKTLRTYRNLNNIFKLRLVLNDIMSGLKTAGSDFHQLGVDCITVYRGQIVRKEELEELKSKVGGLLFFNQFLSATLDSSIAAEFARATYEDPSKEGLLYEIEIDLPTMNTDLTPFAYISQYSSFAEEREVLISMHSLFLIENIELYDNFWVLKLKIVNGIWDADFDERSIFSQQSYEIPIRHLPNEHKQFIVFQLILDILLRLDQTLYAKKELLQFSRSKYENDPMELKKIDDFENYYESEHAVKWYTKDSFLYRLLNTSLRIQTIDHIVKMRYFIHDLHNQLAELQDDFIKSLDGLKFFTLYRGLPMKVNQLNELKENLNNLMSINSFMSATQDIEVAAAFSGNGITTESDEISVIYDMMIDTNIRSTPYAKIKGVMEDEEEILFSIGSVFRIGPVEEMRDRVYSVKLTMVHIEDETWNKLTAHLD